MVILLLLILFLQGYTVHLLWRRQQVTVQLPQEPGGPRPLGEPVILKLCDERGEERHEINSHAPAPDTYTYGGVAYRRFKTLRGSGTSFYLPEAKK